MAFFFSSLTFWRLIKKPLPRIHADYADKNNSDQRLSAFNPRLEFLCNRIIRVRVIVKPLARLSAVPSRHHQPLEQRRRGEALLPELIKHHVRDVVRSVEPYEIQ